MKSGLAEQFSEQMDQTVTEAKAEVESYVAGLVQRTGLEALAEMAPQITEGKEEEEVKRKYVVIILIITFIIIIFRTASSCGAS